MLTRGILLFLAAFTHAAPDPGFFDSIEVGKQTIQAPGAKSKDAAIERIAVVFWS
jgi:hypothetical protein